MFLYDNMSVEDLLEEIERDSDPVRGLSPKMASFAIVYLIDRLVKLEAAHEKLKENYLSHEHNDDDPDYDY